MTRTHVGCAGRERIIRRESGGVVGIGPLASTYRRLYGSEGNLVVTKLTSRRSDYGRRRLGIPDDESLSGLATRNATPDVPYKSVCTSVAKF